MDVGYYTLLKKSLLYTFQLLYSVKKKRRKTFTNKLHIYFQLQILHHESKFQKDPLTFKMVTSLFKMVIILIKIVTTLIKMVTMVTKKGYQNYGNENGYHGNEKWLPW